MNMPLVLLNRRRRGGSFSPYSLFSSTAIGIWLDPSDVANLSWRRNLLTYSEQFNTTAWTTRLADASLTHGITDPTGGTAASTLTSTGAIGRTSWSPGTTLPSGTAVVTSVWLRRRTGTGTVGIYDSSVSQGNQVFVSVTASWARYTVPATIGFTGTQTPGIVLGTTGDAVDFYGFQFELGTSATDYQRISDVNTEVIERFPTATMYQDAAGTVPVYAPGQPVGLRLDKSKGLALGAELVVDPTLDNPSAWTPSAVSVTVAGGNAVWTAAASGVNIQPIAGLAPVVQRSYSAVVDIISISGGGLRLANEAGVGLSPDFTTTGRKTFIFTAPSVSNIILRAVGTTTASVSDYSIKELPGNHATQSVLASRPVYGIEPAGGRRNLLTWTEDFSNPIWVGSPTLTANAAVAPDGTTTADLITAGGMYRSYGPVLGTSYTVTVYAKPFGAASTMRMIGGSGFSPRGEATFNLTAGTVSSGTGTITPVGNGWYRLNVQMTYATANDANIYWDTFGTGAYLWGGQAELGSTATPYQRVSSAFDVTEAGVQTCHYVQYDGSDDGMITNSIDFTATDKMSVFAGVRKTSDGFTTMVELGPVINTTAGSFWLGTNDAAAQDFAFGSSGSSAAYATIDGYAAPTNNMLTGLGDISGDRATLRVNGVQVAQSTGNQGTGNFGNYPLYLGRRGGASLPFNGRDYGILVVGKATTAEEIASTEKWLASKTGVTI